MLKLDSDGIEPSEIIPPLHEIPIEKLPLVSLFSYFGASSKSTTYSSIYNKLDSLISTSSSSLKILEIGTAVGASARALATRFSNSQIYTLDINPSCKKIFSQHPNIQAFTCDCSKKEELENILKSIDQKFNIVIDDGSHIAKDINITFESVHPYLAHDFDYIVEDCDSVGNDGYTQYMQINFGRKPEDNARIEFMALIETLMRSIDQTEPRRSLYYSQKALWYSSRNFDNPS